MKTLMIALLLFALPLTAGESPKKFKVVYTITYESITLGEAAILELELRDDYGKHAAVDVTVQEVSKPAGLIYQIDTTLTLPEDRLWQNLIIPNNGVLVYP